MLIEEVIRSALASVAGGRVYPLDVPENTTAPFVVIRKISDEPLMTLQGYTGTSRYSFAFDCWADTKAIAINTRQEVIAAIEAYAELEIKSREPPEPPDYEFETKSHLEVAQFSFWYEE